MNELEEKVAMLEELIQGFLKRMTVVETEMPEFLKNFLQQYKETLDRIADRIERSNKRYDDHKIQQQIDEVSKLVSTMPKVIGVKNHHHFGKWSRSLIIGAAACLGLTALSIGTALHLWNENGQISESDIKFRMVRQTNPNVARTIDTLYYQNPEKMEAKTKELEAKQLAIAQAEAAAKEKEEQAREAKRQVKRLRRK
ncbi:MAG: hypothetical protein V4594_05715 [Bacteroidota bacterium]